MLYVRFRHEYTNSLNYLRHMEYEATSRVVKDVCGMMQLEVTVITKQRQVEDGSPIERLERPDFRSNPNLVDVQVSHEDDWSVTTIGRQGNAVPGSIRVTTTTEVFKGNKLPDFIDPNQILRVG